MAKAHQTFEFKTCNTILYCRRWKETVEFYQKRLGLPVSFSSDWFVEFLLGGGCRLSIADERRATIKGSGGRGVTLAWEEERIDEAWQQCARLGLNPTPIKPHPWNARVFYLFDPEGHRIELWESTSRDS